MRTSIIGIVLAALTLLGAHALAQPTAMTYQGELRDENGPCNGPYDFRFVLIDAPVGGTPVTGVRCAEGVPVQDGRFVVELDFGGLDYVNYWMEIQVRPATGLGCPNGLGLTTLSPRQKLTPAPMAITSRFSLDSQSLGGLGPNFFRQYTNMFGSLPSSSFTGTYTQPVTLNNSTNLFAGNGSGLTALNATNLSLGTLPDARLSTNVALLNRAGAFTAPQTFAAVTFGATSAFTGAATFTGPAIFNGPITLPATERAFTIPAQGFQPAVAGVEIFSDLSIVRGATAGQIMILHAPVHLPDGAVITGVEWMTTDNDAAQAISFSLHRIDLTTGSGASTMGSAATASGFASPTMQTLGDASVAAATVDNTRFAYYTRAVWATPTTPAAINIRGAKITYTITSPLP